MPMSLTVVNVSAPPSKKKKKKKDLQPLQPLFLLLLRSLQQNKIFLLPNLLYKKHYIALALF